MQSRTPFLLLTDKLVKVQKLLFVPVLNKPQRLQYRQKAFLRPFKWGF